MRILSQILFCFLCIQSVLAQEIPLAGQIFMNPYYYNPAFVGFEDRPAFYVYRRQQWSGIEGAPVTSGFNFQTLFNEKVGLGVYIMNDKRSILSTSKALVTLGYRVSFTEFQYISFAISAGIGSNTIDLDGIPPNDPILSEAQGNALFLDGNAGINYYNKGFNLGFALPKIFKTNSLAESSFDPGEINPLTDAIINTSYRWEISEDKFAFEPFLLYYYSQDLPGQFEVIGLLHLAEVFWIGGSFRQDFGAAGYIGLNIKDNFKFGYAYEFYNAQPAVFDNGTNDIQLALIFGKKKKKGKVNLISQRRNMLQSMGKLPSQQAQKTIKVENDPLAEPEIIYNEADALQDLLDDMDTDEQITEVAPTIVVPEPTPEEDDIDILDTQFDEAEEIPIVAPTPTPAPEPPAEEEYIDIFDTQFDEAEEIPVVAPIPTPVPEPEPEVIDEEEALIRQMEEDFTEEITFEEPAELNTTTEPKAPEEIQEEFIEPTLDDKGFYIGPTTVKKGNHLLELEQGNYVVVGTFGNYRDAEENSDQLFMKGFYTKFGYISQTKIYYVYIFESEDLEEATDTSERFKTIGAQFRENWVLQVQ